MPKMKTNRAAMKRFRVNGAGKIKRDRAYGGHLFTGKPASQRRRLRKSLMVDTADIKRIKRLILT